VPVRRSCGSPGDERPPPPDRIILWSMLNLGRNGGGSETAAPAHHAGLPAGDPTAATYSKIKGRADAESFRHAHVRVRKSEIDRTLCLAPKSCRTTTTGSGSYEEDGRAGTAPWTLGAVLRSVVAGAQPARRFNPRGTEFQGRRAPRSSLHQRQSAAEGPVIDASSSSSVRHCSLWQLMVRTGSIED
jgi:hypothetical protein